jgi:hypothetical protein
VSPDAHHVVIGISLRCAARSLQVINPVSKRYSFAPRSPRAVALECKHCRAVPQKGLGPLDLTTPEAFAMMDGTFDAELVYKIINGRKPVQGHGGNDMPVWGDAFSRSREDRRRARSKIASRRLCVICSESR